MRALAFLMLFTCSVAYAQTADWLDIKPATVLTPEPRAADQTRSQKEQGLIDEFSQRYAQQGKPGIAILWNRRFADVFSQWQADSRQSSEVSMSGRPISNNSGDKNEEDEEDSKEDQDIDCSWYLSSNSSGDCNYTRRTYSEKRIQDDPEKNDIKHSSPLEEFKFNAGYAQTFLSAGAKVIDRATIMRLVERSQQAASGSSSAPDYYRIEADALIGHADYLAEVLLAGPDYEGSGRDTYNVSIKDVKTGQILAMLHTDGISFGADESQSNWYGSSNGYQQGDNLDIAASSDEEQEVGSLGRLVALETMQALNQIWTH